MRKYIFIFIALVFGAMAQANPGPQYDVSSLSEQLVKNADAVVRVEENIFTVKAINEATLQVHMAITILNREGDNFAPMWIHYNPQRRVSNVKCTIYDAQGKEIKRVKNNEIEDFSANSSYSLYEDNRLKYYAYNSNVYPYTIEYRYEMDFKGLFFYPGWNPVTGSDLSVEKSSYSIITPQNLTFRYKAANLDNTPKITPSGNLMTYQWQLENYSALEREPMSPDFSELVPVLHLAPNDFEFEGYAGNMESWENFGKWINLLNKGRDVLPEKTRTEVLTLVAGVDDEREKIRKVYEYMQSKTRYVSIQLGIGGYQPFDATTVDQTGYGDCKALTNYTKALLQTAGITSYYTLIRAGADAAPIMKEFPSTQFNHAILCVPVKNDTIWLECTDQTNPFGHLGYSTSDKDVLLINEEGGKLARTKLYTQEENLQTRSAVVSLGEEGHGKAKIITTYQGLQYDHVSPILEFSLNEQKQIIYQKTGIPNFTLENYSYTVDKEVKVSIEEKLEISLEKYAQISNKRLFFVPNLLNQLDGTPPSLEDRENVVVMKSAFVDSDTITYLLPENMHPEYIPETAHIVTHFGEYSASFQQEQGKLVYIRTFKVNKGYFPATSYPAIVKFYEQVAQKDAQRIVLKKST
ncbi:DUF3857 domain-containing protein [Catalinimonas niigatensis]|uniref:DUF3857 domain-containing protein n=1 Tax=Catalinimonas niigatensis TaxID=1397264 RepID=UPI0026655589|nr:DUF3857 domain-containing protein [Catalinimonas niigatensis]WPP50435.1 DUF3857 domain-containing protein [Catalinimonas niigatensis]